jgi:hypothetical protein
MYLAHKKPSQAENILPLLIRDMVQPRPERRIW